MHGETFATNEQAPQDMGGSSSTRILIGRIKRGSSGSAFWARSPLSSWSLSTPKVATYSCSPSIANGSATHLLTGSFQTSFHGRDGRGHCLPSGQIVHHGPGRQYNMSHLTESHVLLDPTSAMSGDDVQDRQAESYSFTIGIIFAAFELIGLPKEDHWVRHLLTAMSVLWIPVSPVCPLLPTMPPMQLGISTLDASRPAFLWFVPPFGSS